MRRLRKHHDLRRLSKAKTQTPCSALLHPRLSPTPAFADATNAANSTITNPHPTPKSTMKLPPHLLHSQRTTRNILSSMQDRQSVQSRKQIPRTKALRTQRTSLTTERGRPHWRNKEHKRAKTPDFSPECRSSPQPRNAPSLQKHRTHNSPSFNLPRQTTPQQQRQQTTKSSQTKRVQSQYLKKMTPRTRPLFTQTHPQAAERRRTKQQQQELEARICAKK